MFAKKITPEAKQFLLDNSEKSIKILMSSLEENFNIKLSETSVRHHSGRLKPRGNKPSFLSKPIGTERIDKDGYIRIITSEGERLKHHVVFGKPIGKDEILIFADGDKTNCTIDNLMLIKRKYIGAINRIFSNVPNLTPELRKTAVLSAILTVESNEQKNKKRKIKPRSVNHLRIIELHKKGLSIRKISENVEKCRSTVAQIIYNYKRGCYEID